MCESLFQPSGTIAQEAVSHLSSLPNDVSCQKIPPVCLGDLTMADSLGGIDGILSLSGRCHGWRGRWCLKASHMHHAFAFLAADAGNQPGTQLILDRHAREK